MDIRSWSTFKRPDQDLSRIASFRLGPLQVSPSLRRLSRADQEIVLEPRVMRVLVALVAAGGNVLSRDALIETCWDGQIVGDNAINRVVSRLRQALADLDGETVRIETITKVGFRLVLDGDLPSPEPTVADPFRGEAEDRRPRRLSRRTVAGAAIAVGGAIAIGFTAWQPGRRHEPDPRAKDLYDRAQILQKTGGIGTMAQAISFYKQAVAIDPDYADAWGALAIGYRHGLDGFTHEEKLAYPRLLASAARRALALDPDQADARLALVLAYPNSGRWLTHERSLRRLQARYPDYWYVHAQLGLLLQDVGRFEEAIAVAQRTLAIDPLLPIGWAALARAFFFAGHDQDAETTLDRAFARWPAHPFLWFTRYEILVSSRRYAGAAAFARDLRTLPEEFLPHFPETYGGLAEALSKKDTAGIAKAVTYLRGHLNDIAVAVRFAPLLAMLGAGDLALDALHAFYFGGIVDGKAIAPPDALDHRPTMPLFSPPILGLRKDPRHADMLRRTGLENYWRQSGSQPDFRRS